MRPDEVEGPAKRSSAMAMEPEPPLRPPGKPEKAAAALIMEDGSAKADEGRTCACGREGGGGGAAPHLGLRNGCNHLVTGYRQVNLQVKKCMAPPLYLVGPESEPAAVAAADDGG